MSEVEHQMMTCRVETETIQRLHRLAGERQIETGRFVAVSDIIRQALRDYLRKHEQ